MWAWTLVLPVSPLDKCRVITLRTFACLWSHNDEKAALRLFKLVRSDRGTVVMVENN